MSKRTLLHERIQREHEELRELLGSVHRCVVEQSESVGGLARMLASLSDHVQQHFEDEDTDGLLDQIVEQAPRLSHHAGEIRAEHVRLLETVRKLQQHAKNGDGSVDWWQGLESDFHDFSKELMQHETRENELLLDAYDQDIGSQD